MTEIVKLVDKHSDEEVEPTSLSGVWTLLHCLLYFNYVMTVGQKESDKNEKQCALSDGCSRVEIQIPDECVCVCVESSPWHQYTEPFYSVGPRPRSAATHLCFQFGGGKIISDG